jgi:hypothetical protein
VIEKMMTFAIILERYKIVQGDKGGWHKKCNLFLKEISKNHLVLSLGQRYIANFGRFRIRLFCVVLPSRLPRKPIAF